MFLKSKKHLSVIAALNIFVFMGTPLHADTTLVNPDTQTRRILLDHLTETVPNFDAIARGSAIVLQADEFTRDAAKSAEIERLRAVWESFSKADALQFNIPVYLGNYNASAAGFPLSVFAPGTYVQGDIPITFRNASEMSTFPVSIENGRQVIGLLDTARSAIANVTLKDLAPSKVKAGTIEGRISEVILSNRAGTEIGRYVATDRVVSGDLGDRLAPQIAGSSIANSLGTPSVGAAWAEALPFLKKQGFVSGSGQNFSGELFRIEGGEVLSQRPLDRYQQLTLGFGKTEQTAVLARKELTRRSFGFDAPQRPFGNLDCTTPNETDSCGIMQFEQRGDQLVLVDMMVLADVPDIAYGAQFSSLPFDTTVIEKMDSADTQVGYLGYELGGTSNTAAAAKVYWSGELRNTRVPLHDLRNGFSETFAADVMLWLIDNQSGGSIIVARSSLPSLK